MELNGVDYKMEENMKSKLMVFSGIIAIGLLAIGLFIFGATILTSSEEISSELMLVGQSEESRIRGIFVFVKFLNNNLSKKFSSC